MESDIYHHSRDFELFNKLWKIISSFLLNGEHFELNFIENVCLNVVNKYINLKINNLQIQNQLSKIYFPNLIETLEMKEFIKNINHLFSNIENCSRNFQDKNKFIWFFHTFYEFIFFPLINLDYTKCKDFLSINDLHKFKREASLYFKNTPKIHQGTYYTPEKIANFMVEKSFEIYHIYSQKKEFKILDLCSGTGIFYINICSYLVEKGIFPYDKVFALDIDEYAILFLKIQIILHYLENYRREIDELNIILGIVDKNVLKLDIFDVNISDFYKFDLIISNPPYISEKDNKKLLDLSKKNFLFNKYYMQRMDFYLYFLGFAYEIAKNEGILCFITPNYFLFNENALKIRKILYENIKKLYYYDFGEISLFSLAPGLHSAIYYIILNKNSNELLLNYSKQVFYYEIPNNNIESKSIINLKPKKKYPLNDIFNPKHSYIINFGEFENLSILNDSNSNFIKLSKIAEIRQGVVAGPDKLRRKHYRLLNLHNSSNRIGVFIISKTELDSLHLNSCELKFIYPFIHAKDLSNLKLTLNNDENINLWNFYIIYIDRESILSEKDHPHIFNHLNQYKEILLGRREVKLGRIKWYELHWPREKSLFMNERIISVRMTKNPQFYLTKRSFMTDLSTNIIKSKKINLEFIFHCLNCDFGQNFFKKFSKYKGKLMQIDGKLLKSFPIPNLKNEEITFIDKIYSQYKTNPNNIDNMWILSFIDSWYINNKVSIKKILKDKLQNESENITNRFKSKINNFLSD